MAITNITTNEITNILKRNVKGTMALTVDLESPMDGKGKMKKTGNPYVGLGLVKKVTLNGIVGHIYNNSINRQAQREDKQERQAKQHPWGDMDEQHLFRIHRKTGKIYLPMQVQSSTTHGYFLPDGTQIPEENIKPFLPKKQRSSSQEDLTKEIIVRDYGIKNIVGMRFKGINFEIGPEHPEIQAETVEREQTSQMATA